MVTIDWVTELALRDVEGLLSAVPVAQVSTLAEDAVELLKRQYSAAYLSLSRDNPPRALIKLVSDAVFRVLRNVGNEGIIREADGVYSYSRTAGSQSATIEFTRAEQEWLRGFTGISAFGSIRRGGIW